MAKRIAAIPFANTGLVALVHRVLTANRPGLLPPDAMAPDPMKSAVLDAGLKRGLLETVYERAGAAPLLAIGQHLDLIDITPTVDTLLRSRDPTVLADKWLRLERYHHASNRTRIVHGDRSFACTRYAKTGAPSPAENALIAGLIAGLCARTGAVGTLLAFKGAPIRADTLDLNADIDIGDGKSFNISWKAWPGAVPQPAPDAEGLTPLQRLGRLFATDIGRGWRIGDAAPMLALSVRSLQRQLAGKGKSFSTALRQTRINAAGKLLSDGETPLAEIGYCCGYADQAHFQRDFRRAVNVTPAEFRRIAHTA